MSFESQPQFQKTESAHAESDNKISDGMKELIDQQSKHPEYQSNKAQVLKTMFEAARAPQTLEQHADPGSSSAREQWEHLLAVNKLVKESL